MNTRSPIQIEPAFLLYDLPDAKELATHFFHRFGFFEWNDGVIGIARSFPISAMVEYEFTLCPIDLADLQSPPNNVEVGVDLIQGSAIRGPNLF